MNPGDPITVIKCNPEKQETWRYSGRCLAIRPDEVTLEALFNRPDRPFLDLTLAFGDRFVEIYFSNRWYNVYEIHSGQAGPIKGWYCNVSLPAEFNLNKGKLTYTDLALDLWVYPDGRQVVLDEDEFAALQIDRVTAQQARAALGELQTLAGQDGLAGLFLNSPA